MNIEYVYVLKLEDGKFYVGKSKDVDARLREHRKGAKKWAWTAIYKPVQGDDAIYYRDELRHNTSEDAMTIEMMSEYDIKNVRGGTYSSVILPPHHKKTLEDMKSTWEDRCFVCHEKGHFSRSCPNRPTQSRVATSGVDDLTRGMETMSVKPTCGDNGGKNKDGKPCGNPYIGSVCQRCHWHCNDKKCKLPKHIEKRKNRGLN